MHLRLVTGLAPRLGVGFHRPRRRPTSDRRHSLACAGSHGWEAVEECGVGVRRSLGKGGHASADSAEEIT